MIEAHALRRALAEIPEPALAPSAAIEAAIADSVGYLASPAALASVDADTYWPKWDSPWWHMLLLFELGEAHRIPAAIAARMIDGVNALPIRSFPIHPEDSPPGSDPRRDSSCHCALGCLAQVLSACGRDVEHALPWIASWFERYQMADGGLNCDGDAYLQADECPSSMVGTIAPFEAMLLGGAPAPGRRTFVERGAQFLVERRLMLGSPTRHNADERAAAPAWLLPTFPRFYFYDVLRGLRALVRWGGAFRLAAVRDVVAHLIAAYPDGVVPRGRRAFDGHMTIRRDADGTWGTRVLASTFPLLEATSSLGEPCPYLTREWTATRRGLIALLDAGRVG